MWSKSTSSLPLLIFTNYSIMDTSIKIIYKAILSDNANLRCTENLKLGFPSPPNHNLKLYHTLS